MAPQVIQLHEAQFLFASSPALYRAYVGGIGTGKSWICAYDLLKRAKPRRYYMYICPTYRIMERADLQTLRSLARLLRYEAKYHGTKHLLTLGNGARIECCSAEDPDSLRGPNASGAVLIEASLMKKEAYDIAIGRLRECGEQGWLSAGFTPKGRGHWTYEAFATGKPNTELFQSRTADNPFLPEDYEATLRGQYTSAFAEQELNGQFLDQQGTLAKREWFRVVESVERKGQLVRAWDFAATEKTCADYMVGTLLQAEKGRYSVRDVVRRQVGPAEVARLVRAVAEQDGHAVPIVIEQEPGSSGKIASSSIIQALAGFAVRAVPARADKVVRSMPFLAQAEAGHVQLLRGAWNEAWLDEFAAFPGGVHDDQVDSVALAFNSLTQAASGFLY